MRDTLIIVTILVVVCVLLGGLFLGCLCIGYRTSFPGQIAQIDRLRVDAAQVESTVADHVAGQVIECNCFIKSRQRYNQMWWSDWVIPDGWNDVALIALPQQK